MTNCTTNRKKSTLKAYNTATQTLSTGNNIEFSNYEQSGCSIIPSGTIGAKIYKSGLYLVTFTGSAEESGTAGLITVNMYRNGVAVPDAVASSTSSGDTPNTVNLNFATVIEVKCSCGCIDNTTVLTFENTGVGATFSNAEFDIVKLC